MLEHTLYAKKNILPFHIVLISASCAPTSMTHMLVMFLESQISLFKIDSWSCTYNVEFMKHDNNWHDI